MASQFSEELKHHMCSTINRPPKISPSTSTLLTKKDFEDRGIKIDPNWPGIDALAVVANLASEIYSQEQENKKKNQNKNRFQKVRVPRFKRVSASRLKKEEFKEIPESVKNLIEKRLNGTNINRVIQKRLYQTDADHHQCRLSIPVNQIVNQARFLMPGEIERLNEGNPMPIKYFVEPSLQVSSSMVMKKWVLHKGVNGGPYVLITGWNDVRIRNWLNEGDHVQIWSFRVEEELGLALVRVSDHNNNTFSDCQIC